MSLAVAFVLKSSVILAAGLLAAARLSRASATFRHFILACTLLAVVLVVPLGVIVPAWTLQRIAPPTHGDTGVASPAAGAATDDATAVETATEPGPRHASALPAAALGLWTAGALVGVLGLGRALARLRATRRQAVRVVDPRWVALAERAAQRFRVRRPVQLLEAGDNTPPGTWGVVRPCVVVPRSALQWDEGRTEAVLAHELAHVARFDWGVQLAAEFARAVLWWHPLMWALASRLRRESELACDDRVLDAPVHATEYAAHLLDIARTCRTASPSAVPMARLSSLERRIAAMLTPALNRSRPSTLSLAATGALCLLVTAGLGGATFAQTAPLPLVGTVYDPTGAVVPDVSVTLTAQGTATRTTTDGAGRFQFPVTPPGRVQLEASMPGFRALSTEIDLRKASDWDRTITLQVGTVQETITVSASQLTPPAKGSAGPTAVRVGGNIRAPRKLKHVRPVYPEAMRAAGIEGTVPLEAIITASGTVQSVRILSATVHPELALAAVDAVRQWQFEPTLLNGSPVDIAMSTTVTFTIDR